MAVIVCFEGNRDIVAVEGTRIAEKGVDKVYAGD